MGSSQKIPDTSVFSQTGFTEEEYEDEGGGGKGVHGLTGTWEPDCRCEVVIDEGCRPTRYMMLVCNQVLFYSLLGCEIGFVFGNGLISLFLGYHWVEYLGRYGKIHSTMGC